MVLRELIRKFVRSDESRFHDPEGAPIPAAALRRLFFAIRGRLAATVPPGAVVAIRLAHDHRYLTSICACIELGLAFLPMKPAWPESRVDQVRAIAAPAVVIDDAWLALATSAEGIAVDFDDASPPLDGEAPLYVMFTSGSTGVPKGVVIPRRAYESFVRSFPDHVGDLGPDARHLLTPDYTFDISLGDLALFLTRPCQLYFSRFESNLFRLAGEIQLWGITSLTAIPNTVNLMLREGVYERYDFSRLRVLVLGGARVSFGAYQSIVERLPGVRAFNAYGPTEATIYTNVKLLLGDRARELADTTVSIGVPLADVVIQIRDAERRIVREAGRSGEVWLGGRQVMREYIANPEGTEKVLVTEGGVTFYRTGDLGFINEHGDAFITGRLDETIKRRGFRVNLLDIDSYIQQTGCVKDCLTIAVPDADAEHRIVTYAIAAGDPGAWTDQAIRARLVEVLLDYQVPDEIVLLDAFPLNNSGKVSRRALEARYAEGKTRSGA